MQHAPPDQTGRRSAARHLQPERRCATTARRSAVCAARTRIAIVPRINECPGAFSPPEGLGHSSAPCRAATEKRRPAFFRSRLRPGHQLPATPARSRSSRPWPRRRSASSARNVRFVDAGRLAHSILSWRLLHDTGSTWSDQSDSDRHHELGRPWPWSLDDGSGMAPSRRIERHLPALQTGARTSYASSAKWLRRPELYRRDGAHGTSRELSAPYQELLGR